MRTQLRKAQIADAYQPSGTLADARDPNIKHRIVTHCACALVEAGIPADRANSIARVAFLAGAMAVETTRTQVRRNLRLNPGEEAPALRTAWDVVGILARNDWGGTPSASDSGPDEADKYRLQAFRAALKSIAMGHNDPRNLAIETLLTADEWK